MNILESTLNTDGTVLYVICKQGIQTKKESNILNLNEFKLKKKFKRKISICIKLKFRMSPFEIYFS